MPALMALCFEYLSNFSEETADGKGFLEKSYPGVQNAMVNNHIVGMP